MVLKYPAKPKLLKYRRKPKPTAASAVMEKWLHHVKDTDAKNKAKIKTWQDAKKQVDTEKGKREKLKKNIAGIGAVDYRDMWQKKHAAPKRKKTAAVKGHPKKRKPAAKKVAKKKVTRRR